MVGEKISIITISYNSEKTIERTLLSVLQQTYRPLEYVLVDGLSKDGTIKLIESYIPVFEKAGIEVVFKSEPDKGISDAFNKGITRATGTIIGITNSDDAIAENALAEIAAEFDLDIDVICGNCEWNDSLNQITYVRKTKINQISKLKYNMVLMHPTCYVRKVSYDKYGNFDISLKCVMDKDLMARFYKSGAKFKYLDRILAIMSSGGVSDSDVTRVYKEGIIVAKRNGVNPIWAEIRWRIMFIRGLIVSKLKKNHRIWKYTRR